MSTIDCRMGKYQSPFGVLVGSRIGNTALGAPVCDMLCFGDMTLWSRAHCITNLSDGDPAPGMPNAGNEGSGAVTQSTSSKRPIWKADVANGLPAIRFDGSSQYFNIGAGAAPGDVYTIMLVVKQGTATGSRSILEFYTPDGTATGINVYPINGVMKHYHSDGSGGQSQVITTGTLGSDWHVLTIQSEDQNTHRFYIDSVIKQNSAIDQLVVFANDPGLIGAHDNGTLITDFFEGDIAEIAVYNQALNNDARLGAERCLMNKYGIAVPP